MRLLPQNGDTAPLLRLFQLERASSPHVAPLMPSCRADPRIVIHEQCSSMCPLWVQQGFVVGVRFQVFDGGHANGQEVRPELLTSVTMIIDRCQAGQVGPRKSRPFCRDHHLVATCNSCGVECAGRRKRLSTEMLGDSPAGLLQDVQQRERRPLRKRLAPAEVYEALRSLSCGKGAPTLSQESSTGTQHVLPLPNQGPPGNAWHPAFQQIVKRGPRSLRSRDVPQIGRRPRGNGLLGLARAREDQACRPTPCMGHPGLPTPAPRSAQHPGGTRPAPGVSPQRAILAPCSPRQSCSRHHTARPCALRLRCRGL